MPCQASTGQIVITVYQLLKEPQFIEVIDCSVLLFYTPFHNIVKSVTVTGALPKCYTIIVQNILSSAALKSNLTKGTIFLSDRFNSLKNPSKVFKWCRTAISPTENSKTTVSLENNWSVLLGLGLRQK